MKTIIVGLLLASTHGRKTTDEIVSDIQSLLDNAPESATPSITTPAKTATSAKEVMSLLNTQQGATSTATAPNPLPLPGNPMQRPPQFNMNAGVPTNPFAAMPQQQRPVPMMQQPMRFQQQQQMNPMMGRGMIPMQRPQMQPMQQMQQMQQQMPMRQSPMMQQQQQPMQQQPQQNQESGSSRPSWQPPSNHNVFAPQGGIPPPAMLLETNDHGKRASHVSSNSAYHRSTVRSTSFQKKRPNLRSLGLPTHLQDAGYDYNSKAEKLKEYVATAAASAASTASTASSSKATGVSLVEENAHEMLDTSKATDGHLQGTDMNMEIQAAKAKALMEDTTFDYAKRAGIAKEPGMEGLDSMAPATSTATVASNPMPTTAVLTESTSTTFGAYDKESQIQAAEQWMKNNANGIERKSETEQLGKIGDGAPFPTTRHETEVLSSLSPPRFRATSERLVKKDETHEQEYQEKQEDQTATSSSHFYAMHGASPVADQTSVTSVLKAVAAVDTAAAETAKNNGIVLSLKDTLGVVSKEMENNRVPSNELSSTTSQPRFVRSKAETKGIELPTYSNGKPLERKSVELPKYDNSVPLRHIALPVYDNSKPLSRPLLSNNDDQHEVRFKSRMKFPDASKLHWHSWVKKSKDRVRSRVAKALHTKLDE